MGTGQAQSRRTFLRGAGVAVAGAALAPGAYAGADTTIKLAIVGCGGRGTGAVMDAATCGGGPVKLIAMADLFENRLKGSFGHLSGALKEKVDVPPERQFVGFDAYKKAIDCLAPGDVALLTTHAAFRPLHFEYAVSKGVNVFMEKSFAVDSPSTRRLLAAAEASEKKGLKVGCGFMWRHSKARQEVIKRIQGGEIGDLHTLRIYRVHGPVGCPAVPKGANELVFQLQHPACFNWTSGGFLLDWHCHNIDVACWTKGAWPVKAQAMGGRCYPSSGNLFDHYAVEFTFADGTKCFDFARHMNNCWGEYADYAHGTKGSAVIMTNLAEPSPKIYKSQLMDKENLVWRYEGGDVNPYHEEWRVLLGAIRENKPHNEARRAAEANFAGLLGRMAAHSGAYVTWDEALKSDFALVKNIDTMTFESEAPVKAGPDGLYAAPLPGQTKEH